MLKNALPNYKFRNSHLFVPRGNSHTQADTKGTKNSDRTNGRNYVGGFPTVFNSMIEI